jgi:SecD/SecF fusion protein
LVSSKALNKKPSFFGVKESEISDLDADDKEPIVLSRFKNFDFVKLRNRFFMISAILICSGLLVLAFKGLNLGIDFESGTKVEIAADQTLNDNEIIKELTDLGYKPDGVRLKGDDLTMASVIYKDFLEKDDIAKIKSYYKEKYGSEPNSGTVSPTVGRELARNAMIAVGIASLLIILYVTIRFEILMALAAIVALLHDAFFIIAVFSLVQFEVDITFIAAVLTIVGYSINDTVVTFDRIRENMKYSKVKTNEDVARIVNLSLVQTLTRSINTVLTVVIAAGALLIFGSEAISNFSFALLVGLFAGTYSSLFIASQLWYVWKTKQMARNKNKKFKTPSTQN